MSQKSNGSRLSLHCPCPHECEPFVLLLQHALPELAPLYDFSPVVVRRCVWVGSRLVEILPLPPAEKQRAWKCRIRCCDWSICVRECRSETDELIETARVGVERCCARRSNTRSPSRDPADAPPTDHTIVRAHEPARRRVFINARNPRTNAIVQTHDACRPMHAAIAPFALAPSASNTPTANKSEKGIREIQRVRIFLEQLAQHRKASAPFDLFARQIANGHPESARTRKASSVERSPSRFLIRV